jgi:hypothetical protein
MRIFDLVHAHANPQPSATRHGLSDGRHRVHKPGKTISRGGRKPKQSGGAQELAPVESSGTKLVGKFWKVWMQIALTEHCASPAASFSQV